MACSSTSPCLTTSPIPPPSLTLRGRRLSNFRTVIRSATSNPPDPPVPPNPPPPLIYLKPMSELLYRLLVKT
ncbi:unnamed protein product [Arabis nemorensis]|uniref:Uncharacterized protein n=1 Tax=Arabis nemorensis TaxID=586526 RepID=A0A565BTC6_9BRAS|nr:unnamed protein product [Arabis nemorensis]